MKGILLISHGNMAEGTLDSLTYFFREQMQQTGFLTLTMSENPENFKEKLREKIAAVDSGDGVLLFADLYGGTPANQAASLLLEAEETEQLTVIAGFNLPMLMEVMTMREPGPTDHRQIVELGRLGIECLNEVISKRKAQKSVRLYY